jgi:methionine-rich copper-binding protein CopC
VTGTAAVGSPIVGGTATIKCASSTALPASTTSSVGGLSVTLTDQTFPCAIQITGGTINGVANTTAYHSIAMSAGNVNATPLTDLLIANLAGTATPSTWFTNLTTAQLAAITQTKVNTALTNLQSALGSTLPTSINPITTVFTPAVGVLMDDVLSALAKGMTSNGTSHANLLTAAGAATDAVYMLPSGFTLAFTNGFTKTLSGGGTPSITSFTPSALAGEAVTIAGVNLLPVTQVIFTGPTSVTNSSRVVALSNIRTLGVIGAQTATSIATTTPSNFVSGTYTVSVVHPRGEVSIGTLTIIGPVVTSLAPTTVAIGGVATLVGTNLSAVTQVIFTGPTSGANASTIAISNTRTVGLMGAQTETSIAVTLPSNLVAGTYTMSVVHPGGEAPAGTLTVTGGTTTSTTPAITSLSPTTVALGGTITMAGTNLSTVTQAIFTGPASGSNASPNIISNTRTAGVMGTQTATSMAVTLPSTLATGTYTVSLVYPSGEVSAGALTITGPVVTSFAPTTAALGGTVAITGMNLLSVTQVILTGPATGSNSTLTVLNNSRNVATLGVQTATSILVTLPSNVVTGTYAVSVIHPGGEASASGTLSVTTDGNPKVTVAAPASFTATAGSRKVYLSWLAVAGAKGYNIYKSTSSGVSIGGSSKVASCTTCVSSTSPTISDGATTTFTDGLNTFITSPGAAGLLSPATKYYYVIRALNIDGDESVSSAEVSATTGY